MQNDKIKKYIIPFLIGFVISLLIILFAFYSNDQFQIFINNIGGYILLSCVVGFTVAGIYNIKKKSCQIAEHQKKESEKIEQSTHVRSYNHESYYSSGSVKDTPKSVNLTKTSAELELEKIDAMSVNGYEFEKYITKLLEKHGYKTETTQASNDNGVDVIAINKDGVRYAIQCKCYSSAVGISAVQEVSAGLNIYNCQVAVVITNNYFTPAAKKLAEANKVLLWDREMLEKLIKEK